MGFADWHNFQNSFTVNQAQTTDVLKGFADIGKLFPTDPTMSN
jgi:hypothetical protein